MSKTCRTCLHWLPPKGTLRGLCQEHNRATMRRFTCGDWRKDPSPGKPSTDRNIADWARQKIEALESVNRRLRADNERQRNDVLRLAGLLREARSGHGRKLDFVARGE